jgi:hypothetical protein
VQIISFSPFFSLYQAVEGDHLGGMFVKQEESTSEVKQEMSDTVEE